jgi:hypothetical protein
MPAGAFASGLISRTWHPEGNNSLSDGLSSAALMLVYDAGWNIVKEFWPDIRSHLHH